MVLAFIIVCLCLLKKVLIFPMFLARPHNYALCIMNYELNQYSVAVVDFVLYDLGSKTSEFLSLWFEINV